MKKLLLSYKLIAFLLVMTILGCSKDEITEHQAENLEEQFPSLPKNGESVSISAYRNDQGEVEGYFYLSDPTQVYAIGATDAPTQYILSGDIQNLVGDIDNFGYGGGSNPPCRYFDLREEEDIAGGFDSMFANMDTDRAWTHDLTSDPNFCPDRIVEKITIQIHEYFNRGRTTITIDGNEVDFIQNGKTTACGGRTSIQSYTFTGTEASFANDGIINIIVKENGFDVAIDYSLVTVTYATASTIVVNGCDSGVTNHSIGCASMADLINGKNGTYVNHGDFVNYVSDLTNSWKKEGLISGAEKDLIMSCAAGTNNP